MRIAPEGWPFFLIGLVGTALFGLSAVSQVSPLGPVGRGLFTWMTVLTGVLTLFTLFFFRDPAPAVPSGEDLVLAPGEGRVIQITQVEEPVFLQQLATRISIFLSVFNVHVQRAPVTGQVEYRDYTPGKYLAAWNPAASEENEQASIGFQTGDHRVLVRQIAGLVARRVVSDPGEGDSVTRGDRIGIIRFGSRVDLFIPPEWEVKCREGEKVKVGETVLARIPETGNGGGGL
jgi:phosphatidylserine decarboxylase